MSIGSARSLVCRHLLRSNPPRTLAGRLTLVAGAWLLILVAHVVTGGMWTPTLVGTAAIVSALCLAPRLTWLVKPVGAYLGLWLGFNLLRARADDTAWADQVLDLVPRLERWLAGGRIPTVALQEAFHEPGNIDPFDYGWTAVYLSFFIVPHLVAILLLWRRRPAFWRYAIAQGVLFTLAMVGFVVLPTSPPWMIADAVPDAGFGTVHRIVESVLAGMDLPVSLFSETETGRVRTTEVRLEPNPIAAMPSIHFAATALIAFVAWRRGAILFGAALLYTLLMGIALVYLGEHYVLDLAVGGALAGTGWIVAGNCIDAAGSA